MMPNQPNRNLRAVPPRTLSYAEWCSRVDQDVELAVKKIKSKSVCRPAVAHPLKPSAQTAREGLKNLSKLALSIEEIIRMITEVEERGGHSPVTHAQIISAAECLQKAGSIVFTDVRLAFGGRKGIEK